MRGKRDLGGVHSGTEMLGLPLRCFPMQQWPISDFRPIMMLKEYKNTRLRSWNYETTVLWKTSYHLARDLDTAFLLKHDILKAIR
jgi:hypothetical protein